MPMFERLQKPFLTVETGEAYQPIRLSYHLAQKNQLIEALNKLKCCEKNPNATSWNWFWRDECEDLHFESLDSYKKNAEQPLRLGTLTLRDNGLFLNLPSFKRACLAVPFFHRMIASAVVQVDHADFINKVFGLDERLPHGFAELFKEEDLAKLMEQRLHDYEDVQEKVEHAKTAEEAFSILAHYTNAEAKKRLPYAERYSFQESNNADPDVAFLGFYIFLRGRELVAIRRWFGEAGYSLAEAAEETVEQVFGGMNIDIIE